VTLPPDIEAELDAALAPLRAEGLTAEQAAKRLPAHLVGPYWESKVDEYLDRELAKLKAAASERLATLLDGGSADVPVKSTALADLLEVASDDQRLALFGRLQAQVGRDRVNDVWYAATAIEEERAR
jgi:hypothetical protein